MNTLALVERSIRPATARGAVSKLGPVYAGRVHQVSASRISWAFTGLVMTTNFHSNATPRANRPPRGAPV